MQKIKTVVLVDVRKLQPPTLEAITNAKHGEFVHCDVSELDAFMPLTIIEDDGKSLAAGKKKEGK